MILNILTVIQFSIIFRLRTTLVVWNTAWDMHLIPAKILTIYSPQNSAKSTKYMRKFLMQSQMFHQIIQRSTKVSWRSLWKHFGSTLAISSEQNIRVNITGEKFWLHGHVGSSSYQYLSPFWLMVRMIFNAKNIVIFTTLECNLTIWLAVL